MPDIIAQDNIAYSIDKIIPSANAPVTRVLWVCDDLPEGLTMSTSGIISGKPVIDRDEIYDLSTNTFINGWKPISDWNFSGGGNN